MVIGIRTYGEIAQYVRLRSEAEAVLFMAVDPAHRQVVEGGNEIFKGMHNYVAPEYSADWMIDDIKNTETLISIIKMDLHARTVEPLPENPDWEEMARKLSFFGGEEEGKKLAAKRRARWERWGC
jgi:hypothetical protein